MSNPDLILTETDDGRTISVAVGAVFAVTLHENASTGFRWASEQLDTKLIGVLDTSSQPRSGAVGGGGHAHWTFQTLQTGKTQVSFKLWRPWEGEASTQQRFAVTLVIGS